MENTIMLSRTHPEDRNRRFRMLGLGLGLAVALLGNFGDRAFMASAANAGIDPLQILDTSVKNNILFMISTSDTLSGTPESGGLPLGVGGDDPASRFYQMKRAIRDFVANNQAKANFGVASFHPEAAEHVVESTNGVVYVSQDPTGANYINNFNRTGGSVIAINFGATNPSGATDQTNNSSTHTTAAYTPAANSLLVLFVVANNGTTFSSVGGHGLAAGTYTQVGSTLTAGGQSMSLWVAKSGGAPTSAGATVTVTNNRPVSMVEYYVTGADLSGTAAQALSQNPTATGTGTSATNPLAATALTGSAGMYFISHNKNEGTTAGTGWAEGSDTLATHTSGSPSNDAGIESQYTTTFSIPAQQAFWSTSSAWGAFAIEIKAAAAPAPIDTCAGALCTAAESAAIFDQFQSNDVVTSAAYPVGCTNQGADQVGALGVGNTPLTHVLNTNCRYYIRSKIAISGKRYTINRANPAASAVVTSTNITCPNPPPGLLADDVLAANDGTLPRACFELQDVTPAATNRVTTYWLTGVQFNYSTVTDPGILPRRANETGLNVDIEECNGVDNTPAISALTRLELQYDGSGNPIGMPGLTPVGGLKPSSPTFTNVGQRLGTGSPITNSLAWALNYFRTNVLTASGTLKRPVIAQGKQKQFVVMLVDADDTFNTLAQAQQAAYNLYSNTLPALPACAANCGASGDLTAAAWAAANRIELVLVPFGAAPGPALAPETQASMDAISLAGSGLNPLNVQCDPGSPCRTAPIAHTYNELLAAIQNAVFSSSSTGTFSDQQSVTETVFEFASLATPSKDPLDPYERFAVALPVLLQSTFDMPTFKGHLNAITRNINGTPADPTDDFPQKQWDAGEMLYQRVANVSSTLGVTFTGIGTMTPGTGYPFATLHASATPSTIHASTAKIKRRIYTTSQNGVNVNYNVTNLLSANVANLAGSAAGFKRVPLWPPTTGDGDLTYVAPTTTGSTATPKRGLLDAAMGFTAWTTMAQVQAVVPFACSGPGLHAECTSATAGVPLARTKREAREIILAYLAGARVLAPNGVPTRVSGELQYEVRPWILVESTLASPGVVTPPLLAGPAAGQLGANEYNYYRDGLRAAGTLAPINGVLNGVGLRNPDRVDATAAQSVKDAAQADLTLKPSMSVVYHSTNQGLHAFRAGPCPVPPSGSGISAASIPCAGEHGGEELWAFVPFDLLYKLPALITPQTRANKQYLLASPVRFADVFVPGAGTFNGTAFTGVWRTLLYFGRGQGGKYYTSLDVTTPGPFTRHSLDTTEPVAVWSRGNPDTTTGAACASGTPNNTAGDCTSYGKMGETWSVPALGYVTNYGSVNFALFTGSGYSDVAGEGKTFFVLDALNGNILKTFDIADNGSVPAQVPTLTNFLVASPVGYAEDASGNSPSGYNFLGNPITVETKKVYFPDLHSRVWRYDTTTPNSAPQIIFSADIPTIGNQPFAVPVSVQQVRTAPAPAPADIQIYAEAGHDRRVVIDPTKPFKAFALKDNGTPATLIFSKDLVNDVGDVYRGTTQPASAFAGTTSPPTPVTFFAGIKFNPGCVSTFDSILFALKGIVTSPGAPPDAAFDLKATGDDSFIEMHGAKINAIRVSGEGSLVVDQGLSAQNVPPPPGLPVPAVPIPGSSGLVRMGLTPGTQDYKDLAATTQPYRFGTSVCKVQ